MSLNSRFDEELKSFVTVFRKTEELINRIKKAEIAGTDYIVFKPQIESRNPENKIIHAKNEIATSILDAKDIQKGKGYSIVGIDEARFLIILLLKFVIL